MQWLGLGFFHQLRHRNSVNVSELAQNSPWLRAFGVIHLLCFILRFIAWGSQRPSSLCPGSVSRLSRLPLSCIWGLAVPCRILPGAADALKTVQCPEQPRTRGATVPPWEPRGHLSCTRASQNNVGRAGGDPGRSVPKSSCSLVQQTPGWDCPGDSPSEEAACVRAGSEFLSLSPRSPWRGS